MDISKLPSETPNQEPQGDKPIMQPQTAQSRAHIQPTTSPALPVTEGEYEIANFYLGGNIRVRLLASAPISEFTKKTIKKLGKHLNLYEDDLPDDKPEEPTEKVE